MASLRIGSRSSALALAQCQLLKEALTRAGYQGAIEVVEFTTSGDIKRDMPATTARDKLDWIAEIQQALRAKEIDIALHSGKDVPVQIASQTVLLPVLERAPAADVCIVRSSLGSGFSSVADLPERARIGTASRRRRAQLLSVRPDCIVSVLRGNVPTRIQKLNDENECDAIVLAEAGVTRLALDSHISFRIPTRSFVPAVNQGILLAQIRQPDSELQALLTSISSPTTRRASVIERQVVAALGADCHSSLGVYASFDEAGSITLSAQVFSVDGASVVAVSGTSEAWSGMSAGDIETADQLLASTLITELIENGAKELLHS